MTSAPDTLPPPKRKPSSPHPTNHRSIRTFIENYRAAHNLSRRDMAERCGVGHDVISKIANGIPPAPATIIRIASALGVQPLEMGATDEAPTPPAVRNLIHIARTWSGLSSATLARVIGTSRQRMEQLEKLGKDPDRRTLDAIAKATGVLPEFLYGDTNLLAPHPTDSGPTRLPPAPGRRMWRSPAFDIAVSATLATARAFGNSQLEVLTAAIAMLTEDDDTDDH